MSSEKQVLKDNFIHFLSDFKQDNNNPNLYARTLKKDDIEYADGHKNVLIESMYEDWRRYRSIKVNWDDKEGGKRTILFQSDADSEDSDAKGSDDNITKFTDFNTFKGEFDKVLTIEKHRPSTLLFLAHQTADKGNDQPKITQVMAGAYTTFAVSLPSYCANARDIPPLIPEVDTDFELSFEEHGNLRTQYTTSIQRVTYSRQFRRKGEDTLVNEAVSILFFIWSGSHEVYYDFGAKKVTIDTQTFKKIEDPYKIFDTYLYEKGWHDFTPWEAIKKGVMKAIPQGMNHQEPPTKVFVFPPKLLWTKRQKLSTGASVFSAAGGVAGLVVMSVVFTPGIGLAVYLCSQIASALLVMGGVAYTTYQAKKHQPHVKADPPEVKEGKHGSLETDKHKDDSQKKRPYFYTNPSSGSSRSTSCSSVDGSPGRNSIFSDNGGAPTSASENSEKMTNTKGPLQ